MRKLIEKHWFWKNAFGPKRLINDDIEQVNTKILFSVRIFYILMFIVTTRYLYGINHFLNVGYEYPLWPVFWVKMLPAFPWMVLFITLSFVANLTVIFKPEKLFFRIFLFVSFFLLGALQNSSIKINHALHTLLIPLFCFLFIKFKDNAKRKNFLIFSSAVFSLLMTYSLAGFWKIFRGIKQFMTDEISIFNVNAMSRHLYEQFKYDKLPQITNWIIENESVGFLLLWLGILIEVFALGIFFFGKMHKIWGILLLILHSSIAVVMNVTFAHAAIILLPMLILSPFSKESSGVRIKENN